MKYTELNSIDPKLACSFEYNNRVYSKNKFVKTFFEAKLGMSVVTAFTDGKVFPDKLELDMSGYDTILFLSNGNIVRFWNSEWAGINVEKGNSK